MATESALETWLDRCARTLLFFSPLRHFSLYKYRYAFTPQQLCALVQLTDEALRVPGDLAEIGCYRGYTTVFLNKHLDHVAPDRRYLVIDTFGGFTASSVEHEIKTRGKRSDDRAFKKFTVNSLRTFVETLRLNRINRVTALASDIERAQLPADRRYSFLLLDVDLYAPSKHALELFWPLMTPGGVIVVDDCQTDHVYDGSRQALEEFCQTHGLQFELVAGKLGVLRKPLAAA